MIRSHRLLLGLGLALWAGTPAMAQSIYPVNRAEILVGAKFDFKVELEGKVAPDDIKVTINGRDAAAIFSRKPQIDANEEGLGHTAYWLHDVHLSAPGPYEVTAAAGNVSQTVRWEAFGTPERRARNVILFIGDGLSLAHRTAARVLSKGLVEGRYGAQLAIDDMPHMAHGRDRHRFRQFDERLRHRPQVLRQCNGCLLRTQQERARPS